MSRKLREWTPPKPTEIYTDTLSPKAKLHTRQYDRREGDSFMLIAEFPVIALSRRAAWKEAVRSARAVVRNYLILSVVVEFFPIKDRCLFERIRVFERVNTKE